MSNGIEYLPFMIQDQPSCVWDWDLKETNRKFLEGIDPTYFQHLVRVHAPLLESDDRQYAATALRAGYTQALETFFALLTGALSVPIGIAAWMLRYRNTDLETIVGEWHTSGRLAELALDKHPTWHQASEYVHQYVGWDEATTSRFGSLWSGFAAEYIDKRKLAEYNSIKHGLRVKVGGFYLAIGKEETPGVPAPRENMRLLGKSEFGCSFYEREELAKLNFRLLRRSNNWDPRLFIDGLELLASSINNVVSALLVMNGKPANEVQFICPDDPEFFTALWGYSPHLRTADMNSVLTPAMIKPLSREEIIKAFKGEKEAEALEDSPNGKN